MRAIALKRSPPLAVLAADRLREAIMFGDLKLGEPVSEERIAAMLDVSRTPVREALNTLQMQGLIVIQPQRGSFVFQPTAADIAELCEFRALIEVQAMRLAHEREREGTLTTLRDAEAAQGRAEARAAKVDAARADAAFHDAFLQSSGNSLLQQAYLIASGRVGAIRFVARTSQVSTSRSNREHRAIIRAFAAGDLDACADTLTAHIMRMRDHFDDAFGAGKTR